MTDIGNSDGVYSVLVFIDTKRKKERLPRKKKKWLKKFGGMEWQIKGAKYSKISKATIEDFDRIMKEIGGDKYKVEYIGNNKYLLDYPNFYGVIPADLFDNATKAAVNNSITNLQGND